MKYKQFSRWISCHYVVSLSLLFETVDINNKKREK